MIETMKIIFSTPTLTPRIVSEERSLFARTVSTAIRPDSLMSSILKVDSYCLKFCVFVLSSLYFVLCSLWIRWRLPAEESLPNGKRAKNKVQRTKQKISNFRSQIQDSPETHSDLKASIGSSFAARQAGHKPLIIPTTEETPTPNTAESTLISKGNPIKAEIT